LLVGIACAVAFLVIGLPQGIVNGITSGITAVIFSLKKSGWHSMTLVKGTSYLAIQAAGEIVISPLFFEKLPY
jgi:hypothetical protein